MLKPWMIAGLRGRNGTDSPLSLQDWHCCEAVDVTFDGTVLAERRAGSTNVPLTFSAGFPFTGDIVTLLRHVPGVDETASELWAVDSGTGHVGRLAASSQWTAPTLKDAVFTLPYEITGASLGGYFWLTYNSGQNRSYVWDTSTVRRRGFATPAAPTVATNGGAGLTFTRFYRVRWAEISGSDRVRQSEPSASATITITDDASVRVTQPAVASESETHWIVEYADADAGPWYEVSTILIGTTFYDDSDATVDDTLTLSDEDGDHTPPPAFKYTVKAGARLLNAGAWSATAGSSFVPLPNEVYWTPVQGASDVGDLERQPIAYRVVLDHNVTGLSEPLNGVSYAFGYRGISSLIQTDAPGEGAFRRVTERQDVGAIRHQAILTAEDEFGRQCIYFLSHRGPYRIGPAGMQYLGMDIEDLWATVDLDAAQIVAHGTYDADAHTIYWWVCTEDSTTGYPDLRLRFDTSLGMTDGAQVRGGWVRDNATVGDSPCSCLFSKTTGASMSRGLVPYFSIATNPSGTALWKVDAAAEDDAGTDFQAYVDTKEYAPAGLGRNCTVVEPHLVASVNATASLTIQIRMDFGKVTIPEHAVSLAPEGSETIVQRKLEGLQNAGMGTVRLRIGDGAATATTWTIHAVVGQYEGQDAR